MHAKGDKLDHFTIVGEIGRGGMGTIYKALDEILNRYVALKIIHPQLANDELLMERFKIEATTQAQLSHPNIVTVYSFNRIGNEFVMVMEFVDGQSLKEIIQREHALPIGYAIGIIKSVLSGLAYAHEKQVIHRDVKPANILIGENGTVKLLDFGIAKIFGTEGLTKTGALIGTPWYCSPEQILGQEMDYRTDIYSASVSFYQMITGRVPFDSESNSEYQIQKAHLETPPPRPSLFNSQINRQLERIIIRGLAKKSEKRYASARDMVNELAAVEPLYQRTAEAPVQRRPFGGGHRLYAWFWVLIPLALLLLFLVVRKESNGPAGSPGEAFSPSREVVASIPSPTGASRQGATEGESNKSLKKNIPDRKPDNVEKKKDTEPAKSQSVSPKTNTNTKSKTGPTDVDRRYRDEKALVSAKELMDKRHILQAEVVVDRLLRRNPFPRVSCMAGSVKFFSGKYSQGTALWKRGLAAGAEIRLSVSHAHGFVDRGCLGVLIIRSKILQFDSVSKSEHSFAIMSEELLSVTERGNRLTVSWKDKRGKVNREYFLLDWSRRETDVERFVRFLSDVFKEE